jgi:cardiolipin synthase
MTIPNLITIGRLVLVPFVVAMIAQGEWDLAFAAFLIAGISDGVDGFIARRFAMTSELGAFIDPLADKALLVSIYVALAVQGVLPAWLAIVVVSRDAMILCAIMVSWLMERPIAIRPPFISKLNTAVQIAFAAFVLGAKAWDAEMGGVASWAMATVAILTGLSAAASLQVWLRHMATKA